MNATVWASTASLELAECTTEQRRRDQAQPRLTAPADNAPRRTLQPGDVPLVRKSAGQADPTSSASSKRSDRGAFIKPLDEPIIDTTSDNMWVEAFVTFVSTFAAVERKMILIRGRELKRRTMLHWRRSSSSTLTKGNRLGGWPIAASGGAIARRGSPVEFSERPGFRGAFVLFGNPQRLHPVNNAKTGRQRSC